MKVRWQNDQRTDWTTKVKREKANAAVNEYSTARSESEVLYRASLSAWQGFDRWISRGPNQGDERHKETDKGPG